MLLKYRVVDNKKTEMLDIVDEHDNIIGKTDRLNYKDQNFVPEKKFARTVGCFIVNGDNMILTPTRSPNKRSFPNALDFSCGGYVQSGETYDDAIIGELKEESNLNVSQEDLIFLGKLTPLDDLINVFMGVYKYVTNSEIDYNKEDFTKVEWLTCEEFIKKIQNGIPCKNTLLPALLKFQSSL